MALSFGLSFTLRDQFSGPAAGIRRSMRSLTGDIDNNMRSIMTTVRNTAGVMTVAGGAALRTMGQWTKVGAEFGDTMIMVKNVTKGGAENIGAIEEEIRRLGQSTIFTSQEIASAAEFLGRAGNDAGQVMNNLEAAVNLAGATRAALGGKGGTADIMTNIMSAFQIDAERAVDVADMLTAATINSNTHITGLGESLRYAASTLRGLNVPLGESLALLGILGSGGLQDSMAGTAIQNMFKFMTQASGGFATAKQQKAMGLLGMTRGDLVGRNGELRKTGDILQLIAQRTKNMGAVDKANVLLGIFGVRGFRAIEPMLRNMENYESLLKSINKESSGISQNIMEERMGSMAGSFRELASIWENFKITFAKSIEPVLKPLINGLSLILKGINAILEIPFIGDFIVAGAAGMLTFTTAAAGLVTILTTLRLTFGGLRSRFLGYVTSTVAGYASMSNAARAYGATAAAAGGAGGMASGLFGMMGGFGKIVGRTKGGTFMAATAGGGRRFVKTAVAERYAQRYGSRLVGRGILGGIMGRGAATAGGGILGRLGLGLVGRALGVLGGPIGLLASFVLPGLISAISNWGDDSKDNTAALNKNTNSNVELTSTHVYRDPQMNQIIRTNSYSIEDMKNDRTKWLESIEKDNKEKATNTGHLYEPTIQLNVDGEKAMEKKIKDMEEKVTFDSLQF